MSLLRLGSAPSCPKEAPRCCATFSFLGFPLFATQTWKQNNQRKTYFSLMSLLRLGFAPPLPQGGAKILRNIFGLHGLSYCLPRKLGSKQIKRKKYFLFDCVASKFCGKHRETNKNRKCCAAPWRLLGQGCGANAPLAAPNAKGKVKRHELLGSQHGVVYTMREKMFLAYCAIIWL